MKQRIISLITVVAMVFCLCPQVVAAPGETDTTQYQVVVSIEGGNTATFGDTITLKATVKSSTTAGDFNSATAVSSGSVQFYKETISDETKLGNAISEFANGVATLTLSDISTTTFNAGPNNIVAEYTPSVGEKGEMGGPFALTVNKKANNDSATAPQLSSQGTDSITISGADDHEYYCSTEESVPSQANWTSETSFNSLSAGTLYRIWSRIKATDTVAASQPSEPLAVYTKPEITTESLPAATVGAEYSIELAVDAVESVTWGIKEGSLPEWLKLEGNILSGTPTEANSDGVKFTITATVGTEGSKAIGEKGFNLVVGNPKATVDTEPQAVGQELTYNGTKQGLVSKGSATNGTMKYVSLANGKTPDASTVWSDDIPEETNAGTYYVWWMVDGGENYDDVGPNGPITVEIAKANPDLPTSMYAETGWTLGHEKLRLNLSYYEDWGDLEGIGTWSWDAGDNTSVGNKEGSATFYASFTASNPNFNDITSHPITLNVFAGSSGGSGSTNTGGSSSGGGSYRPSTPSYEYVKPEPPAVNGDSDKTGWDAISDEVLNADDGSTVYVDMKDNTLVPSDFLENIKGKDVNVVLDMGGGVSWEINGKDIYADKLQGLDLGVSIGTDTIPIDIINKVTGERYVMQISVNHIGYFGLTAYLCINLKASNAGYYANLFHYNEKTNDLEFISYSIIGSNGDVRLPFTHASEYAIIIDADIMGNVTPQTPSTDEPISSDPISEPVSSEPTGDSTTSEPSSSTPDNDNPVTGSGGAFIWIAMFVASTAAVAGTAIYKKKRNS